MHKDDEYVLTALGRAVVEAMPDRKEVNRVKRYHQRTGKLPKEYNKDGSKK